MLGYRNPWTRRLDIPYSMYASQGDAIRAVHAAARAHDWPRTAHINPIDERVLWTIHEDHLELYYRERPANAPIAGGG